MQTISVNELKGKLDEGHTLFIVDVRSNAEVHSERPAIDQLKNHPLDQIESFEPPEDTTVYLMCQSGNRSSQAYKKLVEKGHSNIINVEGGLLAWKKHNHPTTKTKGTFPIMRQVQIAAGSLVLLGTIGSTTIHPNFLWLAAFVGAGLTFAGLSGFCGMATVLSKMPWNSAMRQTT